MNTKIIILNIFLLTNALVLKSQTWVNTYDFNPGYPYYEINQFQFLNPNTGWVAIEKPSVATGIILKTVNKGVSWTELNRYYMNSPVNTRSFFVFTDELHGYRSHRPNGSSYTTLDRTDDGGWTWVPKVNNTGIEGDKPLIIFTNSTTGYLYLCQLYNPWTIKVYSTIDRFETSQLIYSDNPPFSRYFRLNDIFLGPSGSIVGIGHDVYTSNLLTDFYRLSYNGVNFSRAYGTSQDGFLHLLYGALTNSGQRYLGTQDVNTYPHLAGTRFYGVDFNEQNSILIDPQTNLYNVGGLSFSDGSKGFTTVDTKVYITTNSGNVWTQEWTFGGTVGSSDAHHRVKSFGDVCYAGVAESQFWTRKIQGTFNTNFDWQGGTPGNIVLDGENFSTPGQYYYKGGTCNLSAPTFVISSGDTTARFYYWGGNLNGSMNPAISPQYLIYEGANVNADYKTKLLTTTNTGLSFANQVKTLKDTNGVTNLIYESMGGGIFFTRTRPDGYFKTEEVCSGTYYATFGNTNPYLAEIKQHPDPAKNMAAVYERREGNDIKIIYSGRYTVGPYFAWGQENVLTISNAPAGFQCFPKLFEIYNSVSDEKIITYLRPDPDITRLYYVKTTTFPSLSQFVLDPSITESISEYAADDITTFGWHDLHVAYRTANNIQYRHYHFERSYSDPQRFPSENFTVSGNYSSTNNSLPDITLKNQSNDPGSPNMQPVVVYQGQQNVTIVPQKKAASKQRGM